MYFAPPSSPGLESPLTPLDGGHNRLGLETFAVLRTREMTLRVAHECFKKKKQPRTGWIKNKWPLTGATFGEEMIVFTVESKST